MMKPLELVENWIMRTRGTGKTTEMIMSLPEYGRYVLVASQEPQYFKRLVCKLRGEEVMSRGTFVSMDNEGSWRGLNAPVYVDHFVLDRLAMRYVNELNSSYRGVYDDKIEPYRIMKGRCYGRIG